MLVTYSTFRRRRSRRSNAGSRWPPSSRRRWRWGNRRGCEEGAARPRPHVVTRRARARPGTRGQQAPFRQKWMITAAGARGAEWERHGRDSTWPRTGGHVRERDRSGPRVLGDVDVSLPARRLAGRVAVPGRTARRRQACDDPVGGPKSDRKSPIAPAAIKAEIDQPASRFDGSSGVAAGRERMPDASDMSAPNGARDVHTYPNHGGDLQSAVDLDIQDTVASAMFITSGSRRRHVRRVLTTAGTGRRQACDVSLETEFRGAVRSCSGRSTAHRPVRPDGQLPRRYGSASGSAARHGGAGALAASVALSSMMQSAWQLTLLWGCGRHGDRRHVDGARRDYRDALVEERRRARPRHALAAECDVARSCPWAGLVAGSGWRAPRAVRRRRGRGFGWPATVARRPARSAAAVWTDDRRHSWGPASLAPWPPSPTRRGRPSGYGPASSSARSTKADRPHLIAALPRYGSKGSARNDGDDGDLRNRGRPRRLLNDATRPHCC